MCMLHIFSVSLYRTISLDLRRLGIAWLWVKCNQSGCYDTCMGASPMHTHVPVRAYLQTLGHASSVSC